jgi:hypothetical protein
MFARAEVDPPTSLQLFQPNKYNLLSVSKKYTPLKRNRECEYKLNLKINKQGVDEKTHSFRELQNYIKVKLEVLHFEPFYQN